MITVHAACSEDTIKKLHGVVLVANMSNNLNNPQLNFNERAEYMAARNMDSVVGFVTQNRIGDSPDFLCMTPGINLDKSKDSDQNYRKPQDIDTDIIIVGRGIYESENPEAAAREYLSINV